MISKGGSMVVYRTFGIDEKVVIGKTNGSLVLPIDWYFYWQIQQSKRLSPLVMAWEIWMIVLSFQDNAKVKERKEEKIFVVQLKYEVLIQHLGQRQSTLISATSLPSQFYLLSPEFAQFQMSCGAFFSWRVCTQGLLLSSFVAVSVVRSTW